jgi:hypothetical protein
LTKRDNHLSPTSDQTANHQTCECKFLRSHYAYSSVGFRRDLCHLPQFVGGKIYWGGWYEAGSAFNDPGRAAVRGAFNLGVIAETLVVPSPWPPA